MGFQTLINYDDASQLSFDTTKVEVSGSLVRLKDLGGSTYATDSPTVETQHRIPATLLTAFAHSASQPSGASVKYQLIIGVTPYWFNTVSSLWEESNGLVSEANTQAEINSNLATLFTQLSLSVSVYVRVRVFLTSNGTALPSVTSVTVTSEMDYLSPVAIAECLVTCYLTDLLGADYAYDADEPAKLYVKSHRAFLHGSKLVQPFTKSVTFDSDGFAQISVIETESIEMPLEFFVTFYEGGYLKQVRCLPAAVPNAPARTLNQISTISNLDMG